MASCERCWEESRGDPDEYHRLVASRNEIGAQACTPEQQAGRAATECPRCKRVAIHQHVGRCMACGYCPHTNTSMMFMGGSEYQEECDDCGAAIKKDKGE